jgi:hypothetical protein
MRWNWHKSTGYLTTHAQPTCLGQCETFDIDAEIVDNQFVPLSLRLTPTHAQRHLSASLDYAGLAAPGVGVRNQQLRLRSVHLALTEK